MCRLRFAQARSYRIQKTKILGTQCSASISSRIRFSPASIQRAVALMASCTFLQSPNDNRYSLYLYWNDRDWNWNYNWLDNNRNANNVSASLAILSFSRLLMNEEARFLKAAPASRRAFFRLRRVFRKAQYISLCRAIVSPTKSSPKSSEC